MKTWTIKVLAQFGLARIPGGEWINFQLQHLAGSRSERVTTARVLEMARALEFVRHHRPLQGARVVEIGTGWDAMGAVSLYVAGAAAVHTYDHLRHARLSAVQQVLALMRTMPDQLATLWGARVQDVQARIDAVFDAESLEDLFDRARIQYVAPGDATQTGLSPGCVDLFFSVAVLEHVPESTLDGLIVESRRVLSKDGVAYHLIGLGDHYDTGFGQVNFLRYPEWLWAFLVKNKFSYHNRLRERQFIDRFTAFGASVIDKKTYVNAEDIDRVKSMIVDRRFAGMTPEELAAWRSELLMVFPTGSTT